VPVSGPVQPGTWLLDAADQLTLEWRQMLGGSGKVEDINRIPY